MTGIDHINTRSDVTIMDAAAVRAHRDEQGIQVTGPGWRMTVAPDGLTALLHGPQDAARPAHPVLLQLHAALDRADRSDETTAVQPPCLEFEERPSGRAHPVVTVVRRSTAWSAARTRIVCGPRGPEFTWTVEGSGALRTTRLFAVRAALGGRGGGLRPSGHDWATLFTPNPGPPRRLTRTARENASIAVCGDARPGRGHWFYTPAPLAFALTGTPMADDAEPERADAADGWCQLGVGAPVDALTFTRLTYEPSDGGFHLALDHEGHTRVARTYSTPAVLVSPGHRDPYEALRAHHDWLTERGWSARPATHPGERPAWWSEPMFCGWGAQMARARDSGLAAPLLSSRAEYDAHLAHLEGHGLVPGTIVIDDKWQEAYGRWQPDEQRWPDLRAWIDERHARGQRVLLWWRAWAHEGVPDAWCVRTPDGAPVALDPEHPDARSHVADSVRYMLSPAGLDADGLKIDFTADTPTGESLRHHGDGWGIALLHRYLGVMYRAAKSAKPDALVITHTPHPAFADVTDMIRLNDMLRLDDPDPYASIVPQMRQRAAVASAGCPDLPVDTDDWCAPDLEQWRAYNAMKDELGVPALYVTTKMDRTGEPLQEVDYAALRQLWARWRTAHGHAAKEGSD
ncbi:hypothetical protein OHR86_00375 [Streptomyces sp. NBC_00441]|uniref:hypothetical protein n=1 Tax=Streptomyces sp. NBC_00441 TaxID=2975742 RepID=UPI002E29542D|nr:hypothetical protein [Streptomyces sp. NBC_00441]